MKNNEEFKRVKVSFNFDKQTKDLLDKLKSKGYSNTSELVNKIMKFDSNSIEEFIKIINILNNPDEKIDRIKVSNGVIILDPETVLKIENFDFTKDLKDFRLMPLNEYNQKVNYKDKFEELEDFVNKCIRSTGYLIKEFDALKKYNDELTERLSLLEKNITNKK